MLTKTDIERIARDYLIKNNYPIIGSGEVIFPEDRDNPEEREYFKKNNIASVSFVSKYLDVPNHILDPGVYIAYVNIITGEVDVPPHLWLAKLKYQCQRSQDLGKLGAAIVVLLSGQDVNTAIKAATNALDNNFIIAAIPYVFGVGLSVWSAYEIYDTYQKEGPKAALLKAGIKVTAVIVGRVVIKNTFKVAGNIYKTADKAWEVYLHHNPNILVITEIFKQSVGKVGDKISNKIVSSKPVQKMLYLHKLNRIKNSLGVNPFQGKTFEQIAKRLEKPGGRRLQKFSSIGKDPANSKGAYFHPATGRKYYLDKAKESTSIKGNQREAPHVDVHRKFNNENIDHKNEIPVWSKIKTLKRKYPIDGELYVPK